MIDKDSEDWKSLPWWFKASLAGSRTRRSAMLAEMVFLLLGFVSWIAIEPDAIITPIIFLMTYLVSRVNRYGDKRQVWK